MYKSATQQAMPQRTAAGLKKFFFVVQLYSIHAYQFTCTMRLYMQQTSFTILRAMKQFLYLLFFAAIAACTKETTTVNLPALTDYYPLQTGRVFTYRLDSTVIAFSGTDLEVRSYLAKDSIADTLRDNKGLLSYRVYRFTTDTLAVQPWQNTGTYYITPADNSIEVMDENNLRFIKLKEPLRNDYTWKGNSYIDTKSATSPYQYMDGWNYTYTNFGLPFTVALGDVQNTVTIMQQDETSPPGPFDPNNYQQRNYSLEVYAKDIGLVYKEFLHWTWQTTPPPARYANDSYGVKLSLLEYH